MKKWLTILMGYISITLSYAQTTDLTFKVDLANKSIASSTGSINNIDFTNKLNFNISGIDLTREIGKQLSGYFTYYCGYVFYSYCNGGNVGSITSPFTLRCTNGISLKGSVTVVGDRNNFNLNNSSIPSSTSRPFHFNIKSSDRYHIRQLAFAFDNISLADTIGISSCTGNMNIKGTYWLNQYNPQTQAVTGNVELPIDNSLNIKLNFTPYIKLRGQANYQATLTKDNHFGNDYGASVTIPYTTNANNIKVKLKNCTQSNNACVLQDERNESNTIPLQLKINQQLVTAIGQEKAITVTQQSSQIDVNLSADENTVKQAKSGTYKSKIALMLTGIF